MRHAYTLVEVSIAMLILAVVMAMALQFTVSARTHEASAAAQDELAEDVLRISAAISDDIALSGWHIPDGTTSGTPAGSGEKALETASGTLTDDLELDRERRYYPYVIGTRNQTGVSPDGVAGIQRGNPIFFGHGEVATQIQLDLPQLVNDLQQKDNVAVSDFGGPVVGPLTWYGAYARDSQSLILLRAFTYDGSGPLEHSDPLRQAKYEAYFRTPGLPQIGFGATDISDRTTWITPGNQGALGVLHATGIYENASGDWVAHVADDVPYGVNLESGYVTTASDGSLKVYPQWETIDPPDHERPASEEVWREYLYTVIRPPRTSNGLGRLVRAHKQRVGASLPAVGSDVGDRISAAPRSAGGEDYVFVINRVLSDNVVRVVFDTYRTDRVDAADVGRLDLNQVRVRLYLARRDASDTSRILSRVVTMTYTMRAKNTSEQRDEDAVLLRGLTGKEAGELVNPNTSTTRRNTLTDKVRDSRVGFPR